jgi:hypothetical protein
VTQNNYLQDICWPNVVLTEAIDGAQWTISALPCHEESAVRVAKMCSLEAPFLNGRCVLNWLTNPELIKEKFHDPDFGFFGVWRNDSVVGVVILKAHQIDLVIELAFCCVNSEYKSTKCSEMIARFSVSLLKNTRAHVLYADCVTHILGAQNALESVGFLPIGVQLGMEIFGGKGGSLSRATTIRYAFYAKEIEASVFQLDQLRLTRRSLILLEAVRSAIRNVDDNVVDFPLKRAS